MLLQVQSRVSAPPNQHVLPSRGPTQAFPPSSSDQINENQPSQSDEGVPNTDGHHSADTQPNPSLLSSSYLASTNAEHRPVGDFYWGYTYEEAMINTGQRPRMPYDFPQQQQQQQQQQQSLEQQQDQFPYQQDQFAQYAYPPQFSVSQTDVTAPSIIAVPVPIPQPNNQQHFYISSTTTTLIPLQSTAYLPSTARVSLPSSSMQYYLSSSADGSQRPPLPVHIRTGPSPARFAEQKANNNNGPPRSNRVDLLAQSDTDSDDIPLESRAARPNRQTIRCRVCLTTRGAENAFFTHCRHSFCVECLAEWAIVRVEDAPTRPIVTVPITCPELDCQQPLETEEVYRLFNQAIQRAERERPSVTEAKETLLHQLSPLPGLVSPRVERLKAILEKYDLSVRNHYLSDRSDYISCSNPRCSAGGFYDPCNTNNNNNTTNSNDTSLSSYHSPRDRTQCDPSKVSCPHCSTQVTLPPAWVRHSQPPQPQIWSGITFISQAAANSFFTHNNIHASTSSSSFTANAYPRRVSSPSLTASESTHTSSPHLERKYEYEELTPGDEPSPSHAATVHYPNNGSGLVPLDTSVPFSYANPPVPGSQLGTRAHPVVVVKNDWLLKSLHFLVTQLHKIGMVEYPLADVEEQEEKIRREEAQSRHWKLQNSRGCPVCRAPFEKEGGCNHMTCRVCHTHFCFKCLSVRGPFGACAVCEKRERAQNAAEADEPGSGINWWRLVPSFIRNRGEDRGHVDVFPTF